ncbi:alpha-pore-forming cytotoxin MakA [Pseudomonas rubra]|uniref:Uncharacterized protein n=1 Tax=Pseudomonas rubra TaxID=2942627 RepID=A0ABT5PBZ0_9PSED|nr:hypothetical protein [Pseudomonas rubra]MDD1015696.1 hypothetical protein [Pseudomonas rubra]MDD1040318.1 hypothetical protein [Pseudomonas rubra]MDD1153909.1 hypothetical protein [Pseudomonas rubra]
MPLNATTCNAQIDASQAAIAMLNASCQAVIEAQIQQLDSPWYAQLDQELGVAENLVSAWRRSGMLYFNNDILGAILNCADAFDNAKGPIDDAFDTLEKAFSDSGRDTLIKQLQALIPPPQTMLGQTDTYLGKLKLFETQMMAAEQNMQTTIGAVQAQAADISCEISIINSRIDALNQQVQTDRQAIAAARSARKRGIFETIFGIVLAPLTGGISLILTGIGAASIADAQSQIDTMGEQIAKFQQNIFADQGSLSDDQKIIATLNGLTLSTGYVLTDMNNINTALDALRMQWTVFAGELGGIVDSLGKASHASDIVVAQAWFESACNEWALIAEHVTQISDASVTSQRKAMG